MATFELNVNIRDDNPTASIKINNGQQQIVQPTAAAKQNGCQSFSFTLPEERNIYKLLSTVLFYPAILGVYIFELFNSIASRSVVNNASAAFADQYWLITVCKFLLIASTLVFYCCDCLNSILAKEYKLGSLITDLLVMIGVIFTFNAFKMSAIGADNKAFPEISFIVFPYLAFMLIYLVRYPLRAKKSGGHDKTRLSRLAVWEALLAILFLAMVYPSIYHPAEYWVLMAVTVLTCVSAVVYVKVSRDVNGL